MKHRIFVLLLATFAGAGLAACDDASPTEAETDTQQLEALAETAAGIGAADGEMANGTHNTPWSVCWPWMPCWSDGSLLAPEAQGAASTGTTWVWDVELGGYIPSDRTGAPADGYRLVFYVLDYRTQTPALPLEEIGYQDMVPAENGIGAAFELTTVDTRGETPDTIADYLLDGWSDQASGLILHLDAVGMASAGGYPIHFDTDEDFRATPAGGLEWEMAFAADFEGTDAVADYDGRVTVAADGTASLDMTIEFTDRGSSWATTFTIDGYGGEAPVIDGIVRLNGERLARVAGHETVPRFTAVAGSLSAEEVESLHTLYFNLYGLAGILDALAPQVYYLP